MSNYKFLLYFVFNFTLLYVPIIQPAFCQVELKPVDLSKVNSKRLQYNLSFKKKFGASPNDFFYPASLNDEKNQSIIKVFIPNEESNEQPYIEGYEYATGNSLFRHNCIGEISAATLLDYNNDGNNEIYYSETIRDTAWIHVYDYEKEAVIFSHVGATARKGIKGKWSCSVTACII